jgi:GAF domain
MAASKQTFAEKDCAAPQPSTPDQEILDQITRSAQYATGASGAALILSDGNIMSCRACSGSLAPPVGTTLNTETGFTATCVHTATLVRCDDTQTDPRVDGSSCKELGIGSILAVPIFNGPGVTGVLEVLSNTPQNFTDRHAAGLQLLGRLVETLSNYDSPNNVSLQSSISDLKPREIEPGSATISDAKITCISCRQDNPQGSQFCNRCGVILFSFLGPEDARVDRPSAVSDSSNDEDLKQIRKVIAGNGLPATWNEISKRLLADQTVRQPVMAAMDPANKTEGATKDIGVEGSAQETTRLKTGLKTGMRTAVRRRLWL